MDYKDEINALAAETLAIQTTLAHILEQLFLIDDPRIAKAIRNGFDQAASDTENIAIQGIEPSDSQRFVKALSVIEELRTATLGDHEKPKRGI